MKCSLGRLGEPHRFGLYLDLWTKQTGYEEWRFEIRPLYIILMLYKIIKYIFDMNKVNGREREVEF